MDDLDRRYGAAVAALEAGQWSRAQQLAESLLPHGPEHPDVHALAGVAALQLRRMPAALAYLRRAVALAPERADYVAELAKATAASGDLGDAVALVDRAVATLPLTPPVLDTFGVIYTRANEHRRAAALFARAVEATPSDASLRFNLGAALTFCGELAGAEREYETCIALQPSHWLAHLSLSQLRRQQADRNHLERLRAQLQRDRGHPGAELYLNLALAKEYEDVGEHARSFEHLVAGKSSEAARRTGARARDAAMFAALMQPFEDGAPPAPGHVSDEPIFVVGMPRTGTTLVERILSSHPDVHSAGELLNFGIALKRASHSVTAPILDADTVERSRRLDWEKLGRDYLDSTRPGTGHTPRFVDKLPHNFLHVGHIARALPGARIICVRRNPLDTCLSNFRQLFAHESPYHDYSYDLLDIGHHYLHFDRLMAHWQASFPDRILQVDYEALVDAQHRTTRRLLEFCGLAWHDDCLRFQDNPAPVATASAVQVRSPLYRSSLDRWKHYREELAPLSALFEQHGIATGN